MDHTRDRLSEPPARGGVANDLHKLRTNGAASAAELREFLSSIRGKSPEDALGAFASSNLIQALLISTIGFLPASRSLAAAASSARTCIA